MRLLASFPEDVESVLIVRADRLEQRGAPFRTLQPEEGADIGYDGEVDPAQTVVTGIARAGIQLVAWAGSEFVAPEGVGAGRADLRQILITETKLDAVIADLRNRVSSDQRVTDGSEQGVPFFAIRVKERSGFDGVEVSAVQYSTFPDPCIAVLTDSLADLIEIVRKLALDGAASSRWLVASRVDVESALLLVRDLEPPLVDGKRKRLLRPQAFSIAMALSDSDPTAFELAIDTPLSDARARRYFEEVLIAYAMGEEDYQLQLDRTAQGLQGRFAVLPDPGGESYLELVVLWLFGIWMNI